jgi:hypothetical protein
MYCTRRHGLGVSWARVGSTLAVLSAVLEGAMDINELTVGQVREIAGLASGLGGCAASLQEGHGYADKVGKPVFIRSVTHHYTGLLVEVYDQEIVIEKAAWIADDGRFSACLKDGTPSEVEPYPEGRVVIGRGAILDVAEWAHNLPDKVTV